MKQLFIIFLLLINNEVNAHECVLKGTTAEEITIYNTCLAHSKNRKLEKNSLTESMLKLKLEKLRKQNLNLKNKLLDLKIRFDSLKSLIDKYVNE